MSVNHLENREGNESSFSLYLLRFVAVVVALLVIVPLLPGLASNLVYSFSGEAPKIYWYLSRSAGFVALTILWISMVLGLGISNKMARLWPGAPAAFAIHEYVSLLGLAFAVYHGLVLMGDHYVDFSLPRLLVPFSIAYEPLWVGLGQIGFYLWVIAVASFYVRRFIGQKTWRLIHYVNFAGYAMGLLHGMFSGTDSSAGWARWYYWLSAGSLLMLLAYRLHDAAVKKSLPALLKQHAQDLTQAVINAAIPLKRRILSPMEKRILDSLRRGKNAFSSSSTGKASTPTVTPSASLQALSEKPAQAPLDEKPELQQLEIPTSEKQSPIPAISASEAETSSPALVEKHEQGSGKSKINIRIFKEPPAEQVIVTQRDNRMKQIAIDPLLMKLKKLFRATPIEPAKPEDKPKRIRILED